MAGTFTDLQRTIFAEIWIKIEIKLFKPVKEKMEKIISVEILHLFMPKKIPQLF